MPKKILDKKEKVKKLNSWFISCYHHCGCKMCTDGLHVWCSGVWCNFIITKKRFDMTYEYNPKTGTFFQHMA